MTLDEFTSDVLKDVIAFHTMWVDEHNKNPEAYPLEIDEDNDGIWWEQFVAFCEMKGR